MEIHNADCLEKMSEMEDNSIDSVVTDPPYGLSDAPDPKEVMKEWLDQGEYDHDSKGFMGQEWDGFVPSPIYFEEMKRVMKPGAHGAVFAGTRTVDWMAMSLRWAGFEYRDTLMWHYGSGFPKNHDMSKAIDKKLGKEDEREFLGYKDSDRPNRVGDTSQSMGGGEYTRAKKTASATNKAQKWEGWGTALKPSWEPIILVRKPLEEDTIANNVMEWGTGAINIDGSRIGFESGGDKASNPSLRDSVKGGNGGNIIAEEDESREYNPDSGRHPANTTLSHTRWCVERGTKKVNGITGGRTEERSGYSNSTEVKQNENYTDEEGKETVENWDCPPCCPVRMMDESSGERKGWQSQNHSSFQIHQGNSLNDSETKREGFHKGYDDSGGASRFFYTGKATKSDRTLDGEVDNPHPTVKPTDLIEWVTKLITPPEGTVLDPYAGSATGGIAVDRLNGQGYNFDWIGIEQSNEYYEICKKRLQASNERDWERHFDLENWKEIDGIGEKTANDLLDTLGSIEEADLSMLESVDGIGEKTANDIRDSLCVDDAQKEVF